MGWNRLVTVVVMTMCVVLSVLLGLARAMDEESIVDGKTAAEAITSSSSLDSKTAAADGGGGGGDAASMKASFSFIHAFFASLSMIIVSEIGDKTFFIAAIMAMKHPRCTIYTGAMLALGLMTLLSALLGNIITKIIPKTYTYYASSVLFALFGLKMLREGMQMDANDASEELEEATSALREQEEKGDTSLELGSPGLKEQMNGGDRQWGRWLRLTTRRFVTLFRKYLSAVLLQAFVLTFLAEWGDRSQISTIILGARENMIGTVLGGTIGHGMCTGLAVIGGRMIAQRISVKTVTLVGAVVFLFFAFSAFFIDPDSY